MASMRKRASKLKALDLFAGCGGLSVGLEQAGIGVVAANEIWDEAAASHIANHPECRMVVGDVTVDAVKADILEAAKVGIDLLVGGPPCQAYSLSGRRDATDPRGKLFEDYVDIVAKLRPRLFMMENVKGLLSMMHDREDLAPKAQRELVELRAAEAALPTKYTRDVEDREALAEGRKKASALRTAMKEYQEPVSTMIIRRFSRLGYSVDFRVLNAADYGVPQRRERVIFIGAQKGQQLKFPSATHSSNHGADLFGKALEPWRTVRQTIDDLKDAPESEALHHLYPSHSAKFLAKIRSTPIGKSVFASYSDAFFRCPPDEPSRTVKENHNGVFVHYDRDRVMTPRELARLQSFPDEFRFVGKKSNVLKQIGNAVPVGLGAALGRAALEMVG